MHELHSKFRVVFQKPKGHVAFICKFEKGGHLNYDAIKLGKEKTHFKYTLIHECYCALWSPIWTLKFYT